MIMKTYKLIYMTKENDVLREEITEQFCIKDARKVASIKLATTSHNDLCRIIVKKV